MLTFIRRLIRGRALGRQLRHTLTLAVPMMFGELSGMLMGVADNIMIGRLGTEPLAAASIAGAAYVLVMLIVWGSVLVLPSPIAEAHERGDGPRIRTLMGAALLLSAVFSAVCMAAMALARANFHLLDQDPEVERLAVDYLGYLVAILPTVVVFSVFVQFADAFTLVRWTMGISIAGLMLDIFLNWVFIFGNLGAPALGLPGAALTTGLTNAVMSLALMLVFGLRPELAYWRRVKVKFIQVWQETKFLLRLGLPSGLQTMVEYGAFAFGTVLIGQMSAEDQAAHQIALNLSTVSFVVVLGLSTAGAIRVGQALAYTNTLKVKLAGLATLVLAVIFMLFPMLAFLLLPKTLASWYSTDPVVLSVAATLLLLAGLFQVADGLQSSSITLLRALGDVRWPTLVSLGAYWLVGIPVGYALAFYAGMRAAGIWVGYLIALILQALFFSMRFFTLDYFKRVNSDTNSVRELPPA